MVRGTGKFKKYSRGGGRSFSKHLALNGDGTAAPDDKGWRTKQDEDDSEEDEDEESAEEQEEEESEEESEDEESGPGVELSRAERKALKKQQAQEKLQKQQQQLAEEEEDADLINPNHVQKKLNISDIGSRELTRKEREAKEKQEAKEKYWKLHREGKTAEAKADLARLEKIKAEREAAQAKRKAEAEELTLCAMFYFTAKAAEIEAKKKAAAGGKRI
ncbi:hypothetical protein ID866_9136 [Astraeus odoratus]|nr:hypothetical protein ID866_9136 [Astraeus odoratus]